MNEVQEMKMRINYQFFSFQLCLAYNFGPIVQYQEVKLKVPAASIILWIKVYLKNGTYE